MTIRGIGPALADSLLYYRQHFGPFQDIDDLIKIRGVGAKRAASLSPFLLFDEVQ
jgi:DNA uptake protein ComE-like DNA-binding protein